ncbi:MAG TPA: 3-isopropylmalate dehydratase small subunit [Candidatus Dormibacteraeota bacterium]|nr:3-isopropylmalate dehydratase small subunit [Candidatus Dormibacteraeota bacterium]
MARAWRFGDFVNTDQIIPGRYNVTTSSAELGRACFIEHRPEYAAQVRPGDLIVAGEDFGCGSSREHAVIAILASGVTAVLAPSFARIFYRNAINRGLAVLESPGAGAVQEGSEIELDVARGRVIDHTANREIVARPLPLFAQRIARHGGVLELVRVHGSLNGVCLPACGSAPDGPVPLSPGRMP